MLCNNWTQVVWSRSRETPEEIAEALTEEPNIACRKGKRRVPCCL